VKKPAVRVFRKFRKKNSLGKKRGFAPPKLRRNYKNFLVVVATPAAASAETAATAAAEPRLPVLLEALAAVHWPSFSRLERHFARLPAIRASRVILLSCPVTGAAVVFIHFFFLHPPNGFDGFQKLLS